MQLPYHDRYAYSPIVDRPDYSWPDGKRLAVYLGLNIEHFAFGAGDGHLLTVAGTPPDPRTFAWRDYGNRVGVWRCLELFDELNLPAAHLINTTVFDYAPQIVAALKARGDEFIGHGRTNAERHGQMWEADEKRFLEEVRDAIEKASGKRPRGWMAPWMSSTPSHARPPEGDRLRLPDGLAGRRPAALDEDALGPADERALSDRDQRQPADPGAPPHARAVPRLHHRPVRGAAAPVGQAAAGVRHRAPHHDRGPALSPADAARGAAAHRQPSAEGQGLVHAAVGDLRPLRRLAQGQISACLAGTIADDLRIARRRSVANAIGECPPHTRETNVRVTSAFDAAGGTSYCGVEVPSCGCVRANALGEPLMDKVGTIGLDTRSRSFQVHGVELRKSL